MCPDILSLHLFPKGYPLLLFLIVSMHDGGNSVVHIAFYNDKEGNCYFFIYLGGNNFV